MMVLAAPLPRNVMLLLTSRSPVEFAFSSPARESRIESSGRRREGDGVVAGGRVGETDRPAEGAVVRRRRAGLGRRVGVVGPVDREGREGNRADREGIDPPRLEDDEPRAGVNREAHRQDGDRAPRESHRNDATGMRLVVVAEGDGEGPVGRVDDDEIDGASPGSQDRQEAGARDPLHPLRQRFEEPPGEILGRRRPAARGARIVVQLLQMSAPLDDFVRRVGAAVELAAGKDRDRTVVCENGQLHAGGPVPGEVADRDLRHRPGGRQLGQGSGGPVRRKAGGGRRTDGPVQDRSPAAEDEGEVGEAIVVQAAGGDRRGRRREREFLGAVAGEVPPAPPGEEPSPFPIGDGNDEPVPLVGFRKPGGQGGDRAAGRNRPWLGKTPRGLAVQEKQLVSASGCGDEVGAPVAVEVTGLEEVDAFRQVDDEPRLAERGRVASGDDSPDRLRSRRAERFRRAVADGHEPGPPRGVRHGEVGESVPVEVGGRQRPRLGPSFGEAPGEDRVARPERLEADVALRAVHAERCLRESRSRTPVGGESRSREDHRPAADHQEDAPLRKPHRSLSSGGDDPGHVPSGKPDLYPVGGSYRPGPPRRSGPGDRGRFFRGRATCPARS